MLAIHVSIPNVMITVTDLVLFPLWQFEQCLLRYLAPVTHTLWNEWLPSTDWCHYTTATTLAEHCWLAYAGV